MFKFFAGITDPGDAQARYHEWSKRLHEDHGGSKDDMQLLNEEYRDWQAFHRRGVFNTTHSAPPVQQNVPLPGSIVLPVFRSTMPAPPPPAPIPMPETRKQVDKTAAHLLQRLGNWLADEWFGPEQKPKRKRRKKTHNLLPNQVRPK